MFDDEGAIGRRDGNQPGDGGAEGSLEMLRGTDGLPWERASGNPA